MLLVDYAASSDEDEPQTHPEEENQRRKESSVERPSFGVAAAAPLPAPPPKGGPLHKHSRNLEPPPSQQAETVSYPTPELKLPDASILLNSPAVSSHLLNSSDHSSCVAVAMAENAARKRDLNVTTASYPRNKVPKGNLRHSKNVPDTGGGQLLPPQLAGRSNIVTEDISKLFVRKNTQCSTE